MSKYPIVTADFENKGMRMALVNQAAGAQPDMADDDSALYHASQSLKAVMKLPGHENTLGGLFHIGMMVSEIADSPAVQILSSLFGKNRQGFWSGIVSVG
jgi:hypothetical protein